MKIVSKDGRLWVEKRDTDYAVGFTRQFLGELEGCWHMLPAANTKTEIKEKQPLVAVETNDGLFSLPSPVSGIIAFFDNKAMNFPEKLTDEDIVCTIKDAAELKKVEETQRQQLEAAVRAFEAQQERRRVEIQAAQPAEVAPGIRPNRQPGWAFFDDVEDERNQVQAQPVRARGNLRGGNR